MDTRAVCRQNKFVYGRADFSDFFLPSEKNQMIEKRISFIWNHVYHVAQLA